MKRIYQNRLLLVTLSALCLLLAASLQADDGETMTGWGGLTVGGAQRTVGNARLLTSFGISYAGTSNSPGGRHFMFGGFAGEYSAAWKFLEVIEVQTPTLPSEYNLSQNYPNPFNPTTVIEFSLPHSGYATLEIYDVIGRRVTTLVDEYLNAGVKRVVWDGHDRTGQEVASGMYLYRLRAGDFVQTKKMVMLK